MSIGRTLAALPLCALFLVLTSVPQLAKAMALPDLDYEDPAAPIVSPQEAASAANASIRVQANDCLCRCSNLTFTDHRNNVHGACQSADSTGKTWCYVEAITSKEGHPSTCQDMRASTRHPGELWSHRACSTPHLEEPYACSHVLKDIQQGQATISLENGYLFIEKHQPSTSEQPAQVKSKRSAEPLFFDPATFFRLFMGPRSGNSVALRPPAISPPSNHPSVRAPNSLSNIFPGLDYHAY